MEMPKVGREMQRLTELFVGSWRGDERLFPSAWDPVGGPAVGTWTVRSVAGGFALALEYIEERDGRVTYQGHGVHAQDAHTGQLAAFWFDSSGVVRKAGVPALQPTSLSSSNCRLSSLPASRSVRMDTARTTARSSRPRPTA